MNRKNILDQISTDYIGLYSLSQDLLLEAIYYKKLNQIKKMICCLHNSYEIGNENAYFILAKYYKHKKNYVLMKKYLLININMLDCLNSMLEIAFYYDDVDDFKNMEKYYMLALEKHNDITAVYNLSQIHKKEQNIEKMLYYYQIGIELGDVDCIYELASYYGEINDYEKMVSYYNDAVEKHTDNLVNDGIIGFDNLILLKNLELKTNLGEKTLKKMVELKNNPNYIIYKNKLNLFTKLNHIQECGICFLTKIHIDLYCGHTFCLDCYPRLYNNKCPVCRFYK